MRFVQVFNEHIYLFLPVCLNVLNMETVCVIFLYLVTYHRCHLVNDIFAKIGSSQLSEDCEQTVYCSVAAVCLGVPILISEKVLKFSPSRVISSAGCAGFSFVHAFLSCLYRM